MPQSTHKSLIHILLWWITILTIIQAVFIIFFFTVGHYGWSQAGGATTQIQENIPHLPPTNSNKAKMFTYKAFKVYTNGSISWRSEDPVEELQDKKEIKVKRDGYHFMCLRITLERCNRSKASETGLDEVSLVKDNDSILVGWIDDKTCSTGVLCKMEQLSIGSTLKVKITKKHLETLNINDTLSVTYLETIFMPNVSP